MSDDGLELQPKMSEEEFQKWFDMLWDRFWRETPGDETVGDMWEFLVSQGFPREEFRAECIRRGIIQEAGRE